MRSTSDSASDPAAPQERGAVIAYLAVLMAALVGISGFVIDGGRLWTQRRLLVVATDAAALAGASAAANQQDACAEAYSYLLANAVSVAAQTCTPVAGGEGGVIEVSAAQEVDYVFASVLGIQSATAMATSTATWAEQAVYGARPIAICEQATPDLVAWLQNPDSSSFTIRIFPDSAHSVANCTAGGAAPGNWGAVDFDGGSNPTGDLNDWLANGYNGGIYTSASTASCSVDPSGCYEGDPGAIAPSLNSGLSALQDLSEAVPVVFYSSAEGNGANLMFRLSKVARAYLTDYRSSGSQASRYLEFTFEPGLVQDGDPPSSTSICGNSLAECQSS